MRTLNLTRAHGACTPLNWYGQISRAVFWFNVQGQKIDHLQFLRQLWCSQVWMAAKNRIQHVENFPSHCACMLILVCVSVFNWMQYIVLLVRQLASQQVYKPYNLQFYKYKIFLRQEILWCGNNWTQWKRGAAGGIMSASVGAKVHIRQRPQ